MPGLEFLIDWQSTASGPPEERDASAFLTVRVGDTVITRNEDLWSRTIRDSVLVSTYPLAMWLASSWWRLNCEPLPGPGARPDVDWRMAHEMGAANRGYVWPHAVFASDTEAMQIWASAPAPSHEQPVRYMNSCATAVPLDVFRADIDGFIETVLRRLAATGQQGSDLARLWALVQADRADPDASRYRRIEAALGFDPDEAPETLMQAALSFAGEIGEKALTEVAPLYGAASTERSLDVLTDVRHRPGLTGVPDIPQIEPALSKNRAERPWQRAVSAARSLRAKLGLAEGKVPDNVLLDLLGLSVAEANRFEGVGALSSFGIPEAGRAMKFIPRKKHPTARRFEFSRFVADLVQAEHEGEWLTATDLSTSRQKYQRAFAAEFLCPIDQLEHFLGGNFSDSDIEEAADHFEVSVRTVDSLLANNGVIAAPWMTDHDPVRPPYPLGWS